MYFDVSSCYRSKDNVNACRQRILQNVFLRLIFSAHFLQVMVMKARVAGDARLPVDPSWEATLKVKSTKVSS